MRLQQLLVSGFRNYRSLSLSLPSGPVLLYGDNGQGKSNLLEAVYLLATSRSFRTRLDRELLNWSLLTEGEPTAAFARIACQLERLTGGIRLDVIIAAALGGVQGGSILEPPTRKQISVNGAKRQPSELIGQLMVTLFTPADLDLVTGPPEMRRRYLDVTLSQTDRQYFRALTSFQRILAQRNALLRALREGQGRVDQLSYWDDELVLAGVLILERRQSAVRRLAELLAPRYAQLTGEATRADLRYVSTLDDVEGADTARPIAQRYLAALHTARRREVAAGQTLTGPHRDDVFFLLGDRSLAGSGSRGQVRSCTVALKLSEVVLMQELTGETPVLLLDDVLSELDRRRRAFLLGALSPDQQVLITTTDLDAFPAEFVARCRRYHVVAGTLSEA